MTTRGEAISRIRNVLKAVKEDPFMTDRFIFSVIMKYSKMLIRRQEREGKIIGYTGLFQFLPCVELIEMDRIPECCTGIKTGCTIRRSKDPLPAIIEGSRGSIIRTVASLDLSTRLERTQPGIYANLTHLTNFKYNPTRYFWLLDNYLYVPDLDWEGVYIEAIFDDDIAPYSCTQDYDQCVRAQDMNLNIPDYLFAEAEQLVLQELLTSGKIPSDGADDSQSALR